jgi:stage II sporulation protein P
MKHHVQRFFRICSRFGALIFAVLILWAACITAGSQTIREAANALWRSIPMRTLRWELGTFYQKDDLSATALLTLSEAPFLLAARPAVAELWSTERAEQPDPETQTEKLEVTPVEEQPVDTPSIIDNGVSAKTLIPTGPDGYTVLGNVYINNSTSYPLTAEEVQQPFSAALSADGPQILILHTHGSEAYTPAEEPDILWSGDHRTTDSRYSVIRVGDEMANTLSAAGISVLHDRTLYDYPEYSGAYDRSLAAIQRYLEQYPSISFILDVHRDAIDDGSGNQYKLVSESGGMAQLSLVIGTDGSGLEHPSWPENLRLAAALQGRLLESHPTLMRPILLRNSRYNQHATTGSLLVEVGAAGNSPEEAVLAGQLFAQELANMLLEK